MSANFYQGQKVRVRCMVGPGALSGEFLVTVGGTPQGEVTGFVRHDFVELSPSEPDFGFISGRVISVDPATVTIQTPGSFFTSAAGRTAILNEKAEENLLPAIE